jgi:hypothetical protein
MINNSTVLAFLNYCSRSLQLKPNTIMVYRNALTHPLQFGFGVNTGNTEFHLLARSQFIANPPVAKPPPSWSLTKVLNLLQSENYRRSKEEPALLQRALFLTALASANRVSELAHLWRPGAAFSEHKTKVTLPVVAGYLYKNQRSNTTPPTIVIQELRNKDGSRHHLCPVKALDNYLSATKHHNSQRIFLSPKTGLPLTAATVAYHLVKTIKVADPAALAVHAHDVRKVSTSLAWARGLNLDELIRSAYWSSANVFIQHYLHPPLAKEAKGVRCVALTTTR